MPAVGLGLLQGQYMYIYDNSITKGPMRGWDGGSKAHGAYMAPTSKLGTIRIVNTYSKLISKIPCY
jgi:hypothetical protein